MYIKIETVGDFVNSYFHLVSQIKGVWLPPVGNLSYKSFLYKYIDEEENSSWQALEDFCSLGINSILGETLWSSQYNDDRGEKEIFFDKIDCIFNSIKLQARGYCKWINRVVDLDGSGVVVREALYREFLNLSKTHSFYIPYSSRYYPRMLRNISDPPLALMVRGNPKLLLKPMISVVGARRASGDSLRESYELSRSLASRGIVVVSGGALGCDIASHLGASSIYDRSRTCNTVVVFAGGLGRLYPKRHRRYFEAIVERGGALLSEKLYFYKNRSGDFPVRNRIISGLSSGVVMIQAGTRSGSFLTGGISINQGRDLYVLLRKSREYEGNIKFFKEGAVGYYGYEDFLNKKFYRYVKS